MIPKLLKIIGRLCVRLLASKYTTVYPDKKLFEHILSKEMRMLFG